MSGSRKARLIALQQGNLDGLCGVYSIVNATSRVIGSLEQQSAQKLFLAIVENLQRKKGGLRFLVDGVSIHDIGASLRDVVEPDFPIARAKPFAKNSGLSLAELWEAMTEFLGEPNRAVILGLTGKYDHWTVATSITASRITLLDSDRLYWLNRSSITTGMPTVRRAHGIPPTMAYFLSYSDDEEQ